MAIVFLSVSLGYWNVTEIITCLVPLNIQKDGQLVFSQPACKQTHVVKKTKTQITPIPFNVNKMHISKYYTLFLIKNTQITHNSKKITSQK